MNSRIDFQVAWVEDKLPFLVCSLLFQLVTALGAAVRLFFPTVGQFNNSKQFLKNTPRFLSMSMDVQYETHQVINPSAYPIATSLVSPERRATAVAVRID